MKRDTRVLFYNNFREELLDLDKNKLKERLYVLYKFNESDGLSFRHHLEARTEEKCSVDEKGVKFNSQKVLSYISKLKAVNFTALIEHYDFEVDFLGNIIFKH